MTNRELAESCIDRFESLCMDKSKVVLKESEVSELHFSNGEVNMLRTTFDATLQLTAIRDHKKGEVSLNKKDQESLDKAINDTVSLTASSNPDDAHDISEFQPKEVFHHGATEADKDKMYDRISEFLEYARDFYPKTCMREGGVSFCKNNCILKNSNGVDYSATTSHYLFGLVFCSKEGDKLSSFNYTHKVMKDIEEPFIESANVRQLLQQSSNEINARPFDHKFIGEVIITPECMESMIVPVLSHLQDYAHITGSSLFKGKLNEKIASEVLTLKASPVSNTFSILRFFNGDGYKNENISIIDKGVLKSNLLTLYGARKTGLDRAKTDGSNLSIDPGNTKLAAMINRTKKGILLSRFSGGIPNTNGDFSGIAKNSYFIENGEIKYPIKEIMITGNLIQMINNVVDLSEESVDFGNAVFPWMKVSGFTISGK